MKQQTLEEKIEIDKKGLAINIITGALVLAAAYQLFNTASKMNYTPSKYLQPENYSIDTPLNTVKYTPIKKQDIKAISYRV